ncbi:MAG TPA: CerR family C-terminal domain-containing protein [Tepidisphaeraceae bacterium]|nr:CerR family C-terminal domain-containing protein [Tepidisphaeraceae bacterium]
MPRPARPTPAVPAPAAAEADETRRRLLDAAGEVFAEQGFKDATVRDICTRAGANVAAIHYHFGDKQRLYAAAVRYCHDHTKRHALEADAPPDTAAPEQRLRAFVRGMLRGTLDDGKPAWHTKLMAREMNEPSAVLNQIVAEGIRPRFELLSAIVRGLVGPGADERVVVRCCRSVVGQCLFYHFARPVLVRLAPGERLDASAVDALADHVAAFSLAGIRAAAKGATRTGGNGKRKGARR